MKEGKLKDMLSYKRLLLKERRELTGKLDDIRENKRKVHEELLALKENWKLSLKQRDAVQKKIDEITNAIKKRRAEGKRGFRMSGLSINIRENLDPSVIQFFNLQEEETISRISLMKNIFNYIREHGLYKSGDKRYISTSGDNPKLEPLINLFGIELNGEDGFRIQRFRSYLEKRINI